jgi:uncharacterized protein
MFPKVVRAVFLLFLVAGVPVLSLTTTSASRIRSVSRPALYVSAVCSQWLLALLGWAVVWLTLPGLAASGFRTIAAGRLLKWRALLVVISLAGIAIMALMERFGWWPPESEVSRLLLPGTPWEKVMAVVLVAPSAGLCEEFLYRGYLLSQLGQYFSSDVWAWIASSAAFGLAHSYQGVSGMVQAALLGVLLGYPVLRLRSIYPSMGAHFLIDAILLAWLGHKLLRPPTPGFTPPDAAAEAGKEPCG